MSNATQVDPPVPSEVLLSLGPTLIGGLLSYLLFGISIMQLYLYHLSFPNDVLIIKATVYIIFVLDIFQSVAAGVSLWHTFCSGWGRPTALTFPGWTYSAVPAVSGIVAAWVQIFYAWRIHILGGNKWRIIPISIIILALAQCAGALGIAIGFIPLKNVARLHDTSMYARTIIWLGGATLTDVIVSVSMIYLLYAVKQTNFAKTQRLINRLIRLTIETGTITATCAALELILFLKFTTTDLHALFALILCKVYSNALMTSLNSRKSLADQYDGSGSSLQWGTVSTPRRTAGSNPKAVIHVTTSTTDGYGTIDSRGKHVYGVDSMEMADNMSTDTGKHGDLSV